MFGGLSGCTLKEMAERELIAESQQGRNVGQLVFGCGQQCTGTLDTLPSEIFREGLTHDAAKQVGAVLFRVAQKVCEDF